MDTLVYYTIYTFVAENHYFIIIYVYIIKCYFINNYNH